MRRRAVGASGLSVGRLGLGTMTWGGDVAPDTARALLRTFVDAGGDLVDTAPAYGGGRAEELLGRFMRSDLRRDDLVIATKAGFGTHGGSQVVDTSKGALLDDLADSLRRLRTDHVDLWQVHAWGDAPLEETLAALDQAVSAGMVRYVGVCNYIGWQLGTAAAWRRAVPGRARLVVARSVLLLARRASRGAASVAASRDGAVSLVATGPGRAHRQVPRWDSAGFPRRTRPHGVVHRALPGRPLECRGGCGGPRCRWLAIDDCPGGVVVGARRPGRDRAAAGGSDRSSCRPLSVDDQTLPKPIVAALDDVTGGPHLGRE